MDILIRLRLVLWVMVLSLWGLMVWQFVGKDDSGLPTQMAWVSHHVDASKPSASGSEEDLPDISAQASAIPASQLFPPKPPKDLTPVHDEALPRPPELAQARIPSAVGAGAAPSVLAVPGYRGPAPPSTRPTPGSESNGEGNTAPPPARRAPPKEEHRSLASLRPIGEGTEQAEQEPVPEGFSRTVVPHFLIYAEGDPPSSDFLQTLAKIHANLMLDLAAFAPWARDESVTIYLFRTQETYRRVTGRPAWSGGASSVRRRKVYLYQSDELVGIMAHELTHVYFDGFFLTGTQDPLWLSEGMATVSQTERGLAAPNWLRQNLAAIRRGGGYKLQDLMEVDNTTSANDGQVRLWYAQSYSVVRFLLRSQYRSSFYKFCKFLRDGSPVQEALYRAYGMPFTSVKALEYAWRYDQQSGIQRVQ
ncbi:MAG: hypothetical protein KGL53_02030 [Elusimicrobia bacterium]|nr:hypothetical protein [Elusimicrobiota bacterium]